MLILLDDIKIRDEGTFLAYLGNEFKSFSPANLEEVREYLLKTDEDIEFLVSDYEEIEDKSFASKLMAILMDVSYIRKNIKLTQM